MRSLIIASLATLALAAPRLSARSACMTASEASQVANNFKDLINLQFNTTLAEEALTTDYTDYSDSVSELIDSGCPDGPATLTAPTFSSRAAFIKSQSGQPPIPFEILNLWNTCSTVIMRWRSSAPGTVQPEEVVTGIVVMETVEGTGAEPWLIQTVFSEFNSGAWLYDNGNFTCSSSSKRSEMPARRTVNLRNEFQGRSILF